MSDCLFPRLIASLLALLWMLGSPRAAYAQAIEGAVGPLVETMAKQLVERKRTRVAAVDFTDIQGRPTELGRFLADQISIDMVMAPGITVLDRANLAAIMAEHKLTAAGLVDPETAKRLGKFAGVDAVIVGNLSILETSVIATVRAISTETAELVAAGRMRFDLTGDARRMLGLSVGTPDPASERSGMAAATGSPERGTVAGALNVRVKNVTYRMVQVAPSVTVPEVSVRLELENRRADAGVALAANSEILPDEFWASPTSGVIFGALQDSSGGRWVIPPGSLRGIPTVAGFETVGAGTSQKVAGRITQNAPSNVVDYIRRGVEHDGQGLLDRTQRMWVGSFGTIEPAQAIEITALFVPAGSIRVTRMRGVEWQRIENAASRGDGFSWPVSSELSLELVTGTLQPNGTPQKSPDLALTNVVIQDVPISRASSDAQ